MIAFRWHLPRGIEGREFRAVLLSALNKTIHSGGIVTATNLVYELLGAIFQGARTIVKRQYLAVVALAALLLPGIAFAQDHAGGGEANLVLPDLRSVTFATFSAWMDTRF